MTISSEEAFLILVKKLQTQGSSLVWSIANEEVMMAIAQNTRPVWGRFSKKLYCIFYVARKLKLSDLVLFFIGFVKAMSIWILVKKDSNTAPENFKKVFAGFGASSEVHLYNEFKESARVPFLYINWVNYSGMAKLGCPSLFKIIKELCRNALGYTAKLKKTFPEIQAYEIDLLTACARNIGIYAFFYPYWEKAKRNAGVEEVIFLALDVSAFACVEANIKTTYLQHGLISFGLLMPNLNSIYVLTEMEKKYLKNLYPSANIVKQNKPIYVSENKNDIVIVLSPNTFLDERISTIKPFVDWARSKKIKIVIRPTNKITHQEIEILKNQFPDCEVDDINASIQRSLEKWQPKFIAAWTSTALALALEYGFLSISFCDPSDPDFQHMIYPLNKRVLFWPLNQMQIEEALASTDFYAAQVSCLQKKEMLS